MQQIHIMSNMVLWCRPSLCKPSPLKKISVPQLSFYFFRSVGPRPNLIDPITSFGNFRGEDHLQYHLLGSKTRTSSAPKLNPQRMPSHGNTMESQIQSFPEKVRREGTERRPTDGGPSKRQLTSRKGQTSRASGACFSL